MGASSTKNYSNTYESINSTVNTVANEECIAYQSAITNDNVFVISNSTLKNVKIGIWQQNQIDASCTITSSINAQVQNMQSNISVQNASSKSDLFGDFSFNAVQNVVNIRQTITNNINNISNQICDSSSITSTSYEYFYITGSTVQNSFIGIDSNTNVTSSCTMSNYISTQIYNSQQSQSNQTAKYAGMIASMAGIITTVIVLIVIAAIAGIAIFVIVAGIKMTKSKNPTSSNSNNSQQSPPTPTPTPTVIPYPVPSYPMPYGYS